jgi:hypothetical protein
MTFLWTHVTSKYEQMLLLRLKRGSFSFPEDVEVEGSTDHETQFFHESFKEKLNLPFGRLIMCPLYEYGIET